MCYKYSMTESKAVTGEGNAPRVTASDIKVGDVIMPPERELRLWMRKHIETHNLPETALHLRVMGIGEDLDKRGTWKVIRAQYPREWGHNGGFTFRARPETPWRIISATPEAIAADKAALAHYKKTHAAALPDEGDESDRVPAKWHDCDVAEKQILELQRQNRRLAEALRDVLDCPDYRGTNTHEIRHARAALVEYEKAAGCATNVV
jgi:hypothetical protein